MLTAHHLSRRYGDAPILSDISFSINPGDRIGLIGPNGAGKSTLLRILVGVESPDSGTVSLAREATIGYLRQGFSDLPDGTLQGLLDGPLDGLLGLQRGLDMATTRFADPGLDPDAVAEAYDHASARFEAAGGYGAIDEFSALLDRFGLGAVSFDTPLGELSGGQKTRAGLAALLASRPDCLILDEPTNHLDLDGQAWLSGFLRHYHGAILVVSHDRGFLNEVVTRIFALSDTTRDVTVYPGNYDAYMRARQHEAEEHAAAYHRQQEEVARIKRDIGVMESNARTIEANTIDYAVRKKAAKIARPAVVRKRKLERLLSDKNRVEKPGLRWKLAVNLDQNVAGATDVVILDKVGVRFGDHVVLRDVSLHVRHGERIALMGANGSGKSTLMKVIAGMLTPTAGERRLGREIRIGYFAQEQETLEPKRTLLDAARDRAAMSERDVRTFLHQFLFTGDQVHRRIEDLSYGERARLMLALMVLQGTDLLLLDEPLNHLDIDAREQFESALEAFPGTMIVVVHDRYTIERLATSTLLMKDGEVREIALPIPATDELVRHE